MDKERMTIEKIIKKITLEHIFILIIFSVLLWSGHANLMSNRLSHANPEGYMASDAFQHQTRAEGLKDLGNYRYEASYNMAGLDDVVGFYMPVIYHIGVIFSDAAGLKTYDGVFHLLFFLSCLAPIVMYFIIRRFNKAVAILSLPLSILIFSNGTYIGFTWGHWPSLIAQVFLLAMFWTLAYFKEKDIYILTAVFLSAVILTHTSEGIYAVIFLGIFFIISLLARDRAMENFKQFFFIGVISLVVCFYYLMIFRVAWYGQYKSAYSFGIERVWGGTPGFYMGYFGWLLVFILLGLVFSLTLLKKRHLAIYVGIFMLLAGYANYIGWSLRAYTIRFFWPIYLSVFFALGLYLILKPIPGLKTRYLYVISLLVIFLLLGFIHIPGIPAYTKIQGSIVNQYQWQAIGWISQDTEPGSKIFFFYGDAYEQDALIRNSKRIHFLIYTDDYVKSLNNMRIEREYITEVPADTGGGNLKRNGLFSYTLRTSQDVPYVSGKRDICTADYYVFDLKSRIPQLAQYNSVIRSVFLETGFMEEVFNNGLTSILINKNPGADCIPKEGVNIGQ